MPPVLGPVSPSPTRLKSWAGREGHGAGAVADCEHRELGTDHALLDDEVRPASPKASPAGTRDRRRASPRTSVTTTPLPAASPSVLTT